MRHAIWLSPLLFLAACAAPTYTLTGLPVGNQVATMDQGAAAVVSTWRDSAVTVKPVDADLAGNLALWVSVANTSNAATDFGTENVTVSYDGQTWLPVKTYEQLKNTLDNKALGAKIAVALLSGLDAWASAASATYTAHGVVSTPYGSSSYSMTAVDPVARQYAVDRAYARGANTMAAIDEAHDQRVAELKARALRTTTVGPQQMFGGLVVADEPALNDKSATTVLVRVAFGSDVHVVQFQAHRPGVLPLSTVDLSGAPALVAEAAHNVAPDAAAAPAGGAAGLVNTVMASSAPSTPACTEDDRAMARLAKKNGFAYHGACAGM